MSRDVIYPHFEMLDILGNKIWVIYPHFEMLDMLGNKIWVIYIHLTTYTIHPHIRTSSPPPHVNEELNFPLPFLKYDGDTEPR